MSMASNLLLAVHSHFNHAAPRFGRDLYVGQVILRFFQTGLHLLYLAHHFHHIEHNLENSLIFLSNSDLQR